MRAPCIALFASLCACSSSNNCPAADCTAFPTFQGCFDDHHGVEGFSVSRAIEICCIDHPIGMAKMNTVCGDTAATCQTYVQMNLTPASASTAEVMQACTDYVHDRGP